VKISFSFSIVDEKTWMFTIVKKNTHKFPSVQVFVIPL